MLASAIRGGVRAGGATRHLRPTYTSPRILSNIPSPRPTITSQLRTTTPHSSSFHTTIPARSQASPTETLTSSTPGWYEQLLHHFDPIVPYVHALPEYLHIDGPHKYAISIAVATICIRAATTLPLHILQRRRTRRYQEIVKPEFDRLRGPTGLPQTLLASSRRAGKSHEQYRQEVESQLRTRFKELVKENKCHPILNIALPLLATIPIFITLSLSIRAGVLQPSPFWNEILPWWTAPEDLTASFQASAQMLADRGMDIEALKHLSQPMGPSLGQSDSTFIGPLVLLVMNWTNIEMTQWVRRSNLSQKSRVDELIEEQEKKRLGVRPGARDVAELGTLRYRIVSWLMRLWAVLMVPLSANVPGALLIYWTSSGAFTFAQNAIFTIRDRRRKKQEQVEQNKPETPLAQKEILKPSATSGAARPPPTTSRRR